MLHKSFRFFWVAVVLCAGCAHKAATYQKATSFSEGESGQASPAYYAPVERLYGQAENILRQRQNVLDVAYQRHPERFVRSAPTPPALPREVWINKPISTPEPLSV